MCGQLRGNECVRGCAFRSVKMSSIAFVSMFSSECVFLSCECFCVFGSFRVCVCVRACVCACVCMCVRVCKCKCLCVCKVV